MKHTLEPERCPGSRSEGHIGCQRCTRCDEHVCVRFVETFTKTLCTGNPAAATVPVTGDAEPLDLEKVLNAIDTLEHAGGEATDVLVAAARDYLRLREQQQTCDEPGCTSADITSLCTDHDRCLTCRQRQRTAPALTLEQVIAACDGNELRILVCAPTNPGDFTNTKVVILRDGEELSHSWAKRWEADEVVQIFGRQGVDELRTRRAAADATLRSIGQEA